MSTRAVTVPAEALERFLRGKGFERNVVRGEVVYDRKHHACPHTIIRVNTTIPAGGAVARGVGKDSIKVYAFHEFGPLPQSRGVAKTVRIFRTGTVEGVLERIEERAREVYRITNKFILSRQNFCPCVLKHRSNYAEFSSETPFG